MSNVIKNLLPNLMEFGYVYKITNTLNGQGYVGLRIANTANDISPEEDIEYWGSSEYLDADYKKYGKENFTKEILCKCSHKRGLKSLEKMYIKLKGTLYPNGYNRHTGGTYFSSNPETRNKISEGQKRYWTNPQTLEARKCRNSRVSKSHTGRKRSDFERKCISEGQKKYWSDPENRKKRIPTMRGKKGIPLSQEHKDKISAATKGKPKSAEHKRKVGETKRGIPRPQEVRDKISATLKKRNRQLKEAQNVESIQI